MPTAQHRMLRAALAAQQAGKTPKETVRAVQTAATRPKKKTTTTTKPKTTTTKTTSKPKTTTTFTQPWEQPPSYMDPIIAYQKTKTETKREETKTTTPDPLADKPDHIPAPPQAPSIYDPGQPLEGRKPSDQVDTGLTPQQEEIIRDAPSPPPQAPSIYDPGQPLAGKRPSDVVDTGPIIVVTPEQHGDVLAAQRRYEQAAKELQDWTSDPEADYYIVPKKEFKPKYLFGPGATLDAASHLPRDDEHIHLSPKQMEIYMKNVSRDYEQIASSIYYDPDIIKFTKKQAVFKVGDKEYTWDELKQKEPALALKRTNEGVIIDYDYTAWFEKQDDLTRSIGRFAGGFASWDYIVETVGRGQYDKGTEIVAKWTYEQQKRLAEGDYVGAIIRTPAVSTVAIPFAGGAVIGAAVKGASAIPGMLAQKGLTHTAKGLQIAGKAIGVGLMGTVVGGAALDVVETYRTEPDKTAAKMLTYGTQFTALRAGAKAGAKAVDSIQQHISLDTRIAVTKDGTLAFQPVRTFYGKKLWRVGDPEVFGQTPSGIARVVSPTPSTAQLKYKWMTPEQFKKLHIQDTSPFRAGGTPGLIPKPDPAVVSYYKKIFVPPDLPTYTVYPTTPTFKQWDAMRVKDYKDFFYAVKDPDYTIKPEIISTKQWDAMRVKYKDMIKDVKDPDYTVKPEIHSIKEWGKMRQKIKDSTPFKDPDYPVKPDIHPVKDWDAMRTKYKDMFPVVKDPDIPVRYIKEWQWQPKTGVHYPLHSPIVPFRAKSLSLYKHPGSPVKYGDYGLPYISPLDPKYFVLESGQIPHVTEGLIKIIKKPKFKDMGKQFREHERGLEKFKGTMQGQKQKTIQILETISKKKPKSELVTKKKTEVPELIKKWYDYDVYLEPLQMQKTKVKSLSIRHPKYKIKDLGKTRDITPIQTVFPVLDIDVSYMPLQIQAQLQQQKQGFDSLYIQLQHQTQGLEQIQPQVTEPIKTSVITTTPITKVITPVPFEPLVVPTYKPPPYDPFKPVDSTWAGIPDFEAELRKESKRIQDFDFLKGYRERKWKTVTMKDLLGW
jgi:hypothetical protein